MIQRDSSVAAGDIQRAAELRLVALPGMPLVREGDDLASLILRALADCRETLKGGDVLVIAQKVISKMEELKRHRLIEARIIGNTGFRYNSFELMRGAVTENSKRCQ